MQLCVAITCCTRSPNRRSGLAACHTYFIWFILLVLVAVLVTYFYDTNKKNQILYLQKSLENVYLKKSISSLTSNLKPRFLTIDYVVQNGDTFENIIDSLIIPSEEKKLFLDTVNRQKEIKTLNQNQEIYFKIDRILPSLIIEIYEFLHCNRRYIHQ